MATAEDANERRGGRGIFWWWLLVALTLPSRNARSSRFIAGPQKVKTLFYPLTKRTSLLSSKWVAAFFGKESDKNCEDIKSEIIFFKK